MFKNFFKTKIVIVIIIALGVSYLYLVGNSGVKLDGLVRKTYFYEGNDFNINVTINDIVDDMIYGSMTVGEAELDLNSITNNFKATIKQQNLISLFLNRKSFILLDNVEMIIKDDKVVINFLKDVTLSGYNLKGIYELKPLMLEYFDKGINNENNEITTIFNDYEVKGIIRKGIIEQLFFVDEFNYVMYQLPKHFDESGKRIKIRDFHFEDLDSDGRKDVVVIYEDFGKVGLDNNKQTKVHFYLQNKQGELKLVADKDVKELMSKQNQVFHLEDIFYTTPYFEYGKSLPYYIDQVVNLSENKLYIGFFLMNNTPRYIYLLVDNVNNIIDYLTQIPEYSFCLNEKIETLKSDFNNDSIEDLVLSQRTFVDFNSEIKDLVFVSTGDSYFLDVEANELLSMVKNTNEETKISKLKKFYTDLENLDFWLGEYGFYEFAEPNTNMSYDINIFKDKSGYYAEVKIDGRMTINRYRCIVRGNNSQIDLYFQRYLKDNFYEQYSQGDMLLSLKFIDGKIHTEWKKMWPILLSYPEQRTEFIYKYPETAEERGDDYGNWCFYSQT